MTPPAAPTWESLAALLVDGGAADGGAADGGAADGGAADGSEGATADVVFWRDSAFWCPYCESVEIVLKERRIGHAVRLAPMRCYGRKKPEAFCDLVGADGTLPVVVVDGVAYPSSRSAIAALCDEDRFPPPTHPSLLGSGALAGSSAVAAALERDARLVAAERELAAAYAAWLLGARDAEARVYGALDAAEALLADKPFFGGEAPSFVDALFAPTLERAAAVAAYWKNASVAGGRVRLDDELPTRRVGLPDPKHAKLQTWAETFAARGTSRRSDWYTHAHALPAQLGGQAFAPGARHSALRHAIDGVDGAWTSTDVRHPDRLQAKAKAAELLVANADALARFASRGCRRPARRRPDRRKAPLADPDLDDASLPDDARPTIDAVLRVVAADLLDVAYDGRLDTVPAAPAAAALGYLRDRIGVPRDCAHPVAHELRSHLAKLHDRLLLGTTEL